MSDEIFLDETSFDAVLVGTSLQLSLLAAGLQVAGKKVLCLDHNEFYGGELTSFSLREFDQWLRGNLSTMETVSSTGEIDAAFLPALNDEVTTTLLTENLTFSPCRPPAVLSNDITAAYFGGSSICFEKDPTVTAVPAAEAVTTSADAAAAATTDDFAPAETIAPAEATMDAVTHSLANLSTTATVDASGTVASGSGTANDAPLAPVPQPAREKFESPPSVALKKARSFSIDLSPRLLFSRGDLVNLLVRSDVAKYMEFRPLNESFIRFSEASGYQKVPLSKSDVFQNKFLSMSEKRALMKLLYAISGEERNESVKETNEAQYGSFADKPLSQYLNSLGLSEKLISLVYHSLVLPSTGSTNLDAITTSVGIREMKAFLASIGRYGPGAFLYPIYGTSELPQAFSRLAAVHGCVYILRFPPAGFVYKPTVTPAESAAAGAPASEASLHTRRVAGIVTQSGQFIRTEFVATSPDYLASTDKSASSAQDSLVTIARGVCLLEGSLTDAAGSTITCPAHLTLPRSELHPNPVQMLALNASTNTSPSDYTLVHLSTLYDPKSADGSATSESLLLPLAQRLFASGPKLVWAGFFSQNVSASLALSASQPDSASSSSSSSSSIASSSPCSFVDANTGGLLVFSRPDSSVALESTVAQATAAFTHICGADIPFLPSTAAGPSELDADERDPEMMDDLSDDEASKAAAATARTEDAAGQEETASSREETVSTEQALASDSVAEPAAVVASAASEADPTTNDQPANNEH